MLCDMYILEGCLHVYIYVNAYTHIHTGATQKIGVQQVFCYVYVYLSVHLCVYL